jgi:uncharacterized protein YqjF (DUF2071 family)
MMQRTARVFLRAEWRYLAMANYVVAPELLAAYVPSGTELDVWQGRTYLSLVGFLFRNTRVLGLPIPWHRTFEEVNLRFYVRRIVAGEVRRAVTFIREIVPRPAIAAVARLTYNEPYVALPMRHLFELSTGSARPHAVEYAWRHAQEWRRVCVEPEGDAHPIAVGSEEEFITEHHWGYTRQRDGGTIEYRVDHPRWNVWRVRRCSIQGDMEPFYGAALAGVLQGAPTSVFLADGSPVAVHRPMRIE